MMPVSHRVQRCLRALGGCWGSHSCMRAWPVLWRMQHVEGRRRRPYAGAIALLCLRRIEERALADREQDRRVSQVPVRRVQNKTP